LRRHTGRGKAQLQPFVTSTLDADGCRQLQAPTSLGPPREIEAFVSIVIIIIIISGSSSSNIIVVVVVAGVVIVVVVEVVFIVLIVNQLLKY
jgi:hypothetical protein